MPKQSILVIDDEKDIQKLIQYNLEKEGYTVLLAGTGEAGLELVKTRRPDLVILDLMLPTIDGYKVCRMLKFDEKYKKIAVIMFTARAQKSDEKLGFEVGADAYMTKPFEPNALLNKIRELLKEA